MIFFRGRRAIGVDHRGRMLYKGTMTTRTNPTELTKLSAQVATLRTRDLRARYVRSDQDGALRAAVRMARLEGVSVFVYRGNAFGSLTYRVVRNVADAADPVNNDAGWYVEVTPTDRVFRHTIEEQG